MKRNEKKAQLNAVFLSATKDVIDEARKSMMPEALVLQETARYRDLLIGYPFSFAVDCHPVSDEEAYQQLHKRLPFVTQEITNALKGLVVEHEATVNWAFEEDDNCLWLISNEITLSINLKQSIAKQAAKARRQDARAKRGFV